MHFDLSVLYEHKTLSSLFLKIKLGKDGKKVKDKLKKLAAKVEEEDFSPDLEMVC